MKTVKNMIDLYFQKHGLKKDSSLYKDYYNFNIKKAPDRAKTIVDYVINRTGTPDLNGITVLDIGCGTGHVVAELSRRGAVAYGVEQDKELVDIGNILHNGTSPILINNDFLSNSLTFNFSFNIILMIDVIEHTRHQKDFIIKATSLLKQGGKIVIVTPNKRCPYDPEGFALKMTFAPLFSILLLNSIIGSIKPEVIVNDWR